MEQQTHVRDQDQSPGAGTGASVPYRYAVYGLTNCLFVPVTPSPLPGDDRNPAMVLLLEVLHGEGGSR